MRSLIPAISGVLLVALSHTASATYLFNFKSPETKKTYLEPSTYENKPNKMPGTESFRDDPTYTELFAVGNLYNGCGLYTNGMAGKNKNGKIKRRGGKCPLDDHNVVNPVMTLAKKHTYNKGHDTFVLDQAIDAVLELIIKVGHPEQEAPQRWIDKNQKERFNMFLVNENGDKEKLAQLLDNINKNKGDEDDGYYHYLYAPAQLPAGTWFPVFKARKGSVEYLARLSQITPSNQVPAPAAIWLIAPGLAGLAYIRRRRSALSA